MVDNEVYFVEEINGRKGVTHRPRSKWHPAMQDFAEVSTYQAIKKEGG
ncbi:MAG: hypothetical protein AABZ62_01670 [Planctomycetota bacterium]